MGTWLHFICFAQTKFIALCLIVMQANNMSCFLVEVEVRLTTSTPNTKRKEKNETMKEFNLVDELQIDGRNLCFHFVRFSIKN